MHLLVSKHQNISVLVALAQIDVYFSYINMHIPQCRFLDSWALNNIMFSCLFHSNESHEDSSL